MLKNNGIFAKIGIMNNEQLTDKQQKFIDGYLSNGGNASKAFIDAGYKDPIQYIQQEKLNKLYKENKCRECA